MRTAVNSPTLGSSATEEAGIGTGLAHQRGGVDAAVERRAGSAAPFLSVVVTTRNDNHGGDLLHRTQVFIDGLAAQANRHGVDTELVIVEWNPPEGRAPLADAFHWPDAGRHFEVRIVTVPQGIHSRLANSARLPLYQMIAKNVGIRRARGQFVLATNIDLLFSDELMAFIARGDLRHDELYRVDRYDAASDVPAGAPIQQQLAWCEDNLVRVCRREGTLDLLTGDFYRIYESTRVPLWLAPWLRVSRYVGRSSVNALMYPFRVARRFLHLAWRFLYLVWRATRRVAIVGWQHAPYILRQGLRAVGGIFISTGRIPRGAPASEGFSLRYARLKLAIRWRAEQVPSLWLPYQNVRAAWRRRLSDRSLRAASSRRRFGPALVAEARARLAATSDLLHLVFLDERARMRLHTNACGDFTLLSREGWIKAGAYAELELFSMHLDSLFLYQAHYSGIRERFLPYRIYHIEHGEGFKPDEESLEELNTRLELAAIPQITNEQFLGWVVEMYQGKVPIFGLDDSWGLPDEPLDETVTVVPAPVAAAALYRGTEAST